jgi:hypothetical protein
MNPTIVSIRDWIAWTINANFFCSDSIRFISRKVDCNQQWWLRLTSSDSSRQLISSIHWQTNRSMNRNVNETKAETQQKQKYQMGELRWFWLLWFQRS